MPRTIRMDPASLGGGAPSHPPDASSSERVSDAPSIEVAQPASSNRAVTRETDDATARVRARAPFPSSASERPPRAAARRCPACKQAFSGDARFCPFDGDALEDALDWDPRADPLIGQVLEGRYEIVSVLGEGGMGTVYEARHAMLGRRFAIKILRRDIADAELNARFMQEAKAAAAIGHPNIVAVSDFGEVEVAGKKVPYFVMEFLTGLSLSERLRAEGKLEPRVVAGVLAQCASGLAAAHKAGVVHRDMKPDNIFLVRDGEHEYVKLLDFGVAKIVGAGRLTQAGMVFGTPHYMSPEQASGNPVDHRADIYALGVILYECLSGKVPFESDTYMGVLTKHLFTKPEPPTFAFPEAPESGVLGAIAMKCLAKSPSERFNDMTEVARALEDAIEASPAPSAAPKRREPLPVALEPIEIPGVGPRRSWILVAAGAVALGAVIIALVARGRGGTESASESVSPPVASSSSPATATSAGTAAPSVSVASTPSATSSVSVPASTASAAAATATTPRTPKTALPPKPHTPKHGGDIINPWDK